MTCIFFIVKTTYVENDSGSGSDFLESADEYQPSNQSDEYGSDFSVNSRKKPKSKKKKVSSNESEKDCIQKTVVHSSKSICLQNVL